jgi:parallel beta-helix repeat protein
MAIIEGPVIANDPHGPIAIDGDANFSATALAEDWSGDGSAQDPYVIENYDITIGPASEASIRITNTRANYTIQGCTLIGPAATPSYGILLENSSHGRIINNMITNFAQGLNVSVGSTYIIVTANNISYNSDGIWCDGSDFLTITQNLCSNNFFTGIYISNSDNGTIRGNNCIGNGVHGIQLTSWSQYNTLTENICKENTNAGFRLQAAIYNVFENNTSNENDVGIQTTASNDNPIHWNIFANNTDNILDDGVNLDWDYNYWSDYTGSDLNSDGFGDTPYTFGYEDQYPLMFLPFPVEWVDTITDQQIEFGSDFLYVVAVSCDAPYEVWVNDSIDFSISNDVITSSITLPIGDYPLLVNATNIYGYMTEADFVVRVRDTIPPNITEPDDLSYRVDDSSSYEIQWTASDLSPLGYAILRNGTELTSSPTTATAWYLSVVVEDLPPGVYNYTVVATDTSGNIAFDVVLVTILPVPLLEAMLPWLIVGIVAIVVVLLIFVVLRKRKSSE